MSVTLQPMTEAEYGAWLRDAVAMYAQEFVDSHVLEPEQAQERAEKDFAGLLGDGLATENHLLWIARDDEAPKMLKPSPGPKAAKAKAKRRA